MGDGDINVASVSNLVQIVKERERYAFLIGAGTSRPFPAEIPTGGELIEEWQEECYEDANPNEEFEMWVKTKEKEMDADSEYGFWFEQCHPTRSERRKYIQELVEDADPTFGHILLALMMEEGYVPHVLTSNFDDLLFDSLYLYLGNRPRTIDHQAVASEFRLTYSEPTIVKLHGDYLYDNHRNTASETASKALDEGMRDALQQTVEEYGLVVVGYSGGDDSIMDPLIEADTSEYGIFWCTRDANSFSDEAKAEKLLEQSNTYLVEIEGFVSLMSKLGKRIDNLEPPQPNEIVDRAEKRANRLEEALEENVTDHEKSESFERAGNKENFSHNREEGFFERIQDRF